MRTVKQREVPGANKARYLFVLNNSETKPQSENIASGSICRVLNPADNTLTVYEFLEKVPSNGEWGDWVKVPTTGGGGTTDYNSLSNKPQIESVTLSGNKTAEALGLQKKIEDGTLPLAKLENQGEANKDKILAVGADGVIVTKFPDNIKAIPTRTVPAYSGWYYIMDERSLEAYIAE